MDPKKLFPDVPEDITALDDEAVKAFLAESEKAVDLIVADDADFLKGLTADEVIAQLEPGVAQVKALREDIASREAAFETYKAKVAETTSALSAEAEPEGDDDGDAVAEEAAEVVAVAEEITEVAAEETVEEPVAVVASVPQPRYSRTPPAPSQDRITVSTPEPKGAALVASGGYREQYAGPLTPTSLAELNRSVCLEHGPAEHNGKQTFVDGPHGRAVFDGPRVKTARVDFDFPSDRVLDGSDDDFDTGSR